VQFGIGKLQDDRVDGAPGEEVGGLGGIPAGQVDAGAVLERVPDGVQHGRLDPERVAGPAASQPDAAMEVHCGPDGARGEELAGGVGIGVGHATELESLVGVEGDAVGDVLHGSKRLAMLERRLGLPLVDRGSRGSALTVEVPVAGVDLYRWLRAVWPKGRRLVGAAEDLLRIAVRASRDQPQDGGRPR
jgi:hypothetical protein